MRTETTEAFEIPPRTCECGFYTTRAVKRPKQGDLTACPGCAVALVFGPDLSLRPIVGADLVGVQPHELEALARLRAKLMEEIEARGIGGLN